MKHKNDKFIIRQDKTIEQIRNISNYGNKSEKDLTKVLSQPKTKTKPKTEPKSTPKPTTKPTPKPKPEIKINKKKLEEIKNDFYELRHQFSKE